MNTKGIVAIFTTGALALGLAVGGVAGFALEQGRSDANAQPASIIIPAVPVQPADNVTPGHRIQILIAPSNVFNLIKEQYDNSLYPNARYEAVPGTYAGDIERAGGQVEQYISHNGNVLTIGVAKGDFADVQQAIAKHYSLMPGYAASVKVYEGNGGGIYSGDYEVFAGGYWFSFTSNLFTSPHAAAPIIQAALQLLPQG